MPRYLAGFTIGCFLVMVYITAVHFYFSLNNNRDIKNSIYNTYASLWSDSIPGASNFEIGKRCQLSPRQDLDCLGIIRGDGPAIQAALAKTREMSKVGDECKLNELVSSCSTLHSAHLYTTDTSILTTEELSFPLAFAIFLHERPEQAERLLRLIYRPHNTYCIHVDGNSNSTIQKLFQHLAKCFTNVHVIEDRVSVNYTTIDFVKSNIKCMKRSVAANAQWKYFINLTGRVLPIKTNLEMVRILKQLNGSNDIESFNYPKFLWYRLKPIFANREAKPQEAILNSEFGYQIAMRKGSTYGSFTREFVHFILDDDIVQKFLFWIRETEAPDETFWSTINSLPWAPGGFQVETFHDKGHQMTTLVLWEWEQPACSNGAVHMVCILGLRELNWLSGRPQLMANKFFEERDPVSVVCLEELVRNRTMNNGADTLDWFYYSRLPHVVEYKNRTTEERSAANRQRIKQQWLREHKIME